MLGWLALVPGLPLALTGKDRLGGSIGQAPRLPPSGTATSRVRFALESEQRPLSLLRPPRRRERGRIARFQGTIPGARAADGEHGRAAAVPVPPTVARRVYGAPPGSGGVPGAARRPRAPAAAAVARLPRAPRPARPLASSHRPRAGRARPRPC